MCVRVVQVKSNDNTKYVELSVEGFWTRVQFPPTPPDSKSLRCASDGGFCFFCDAQGIWRKERHALASGLRFLCSTDQCLHQAACGRALYGFALAYHKCRKDWHTVTALPALYRQPDQSALIDFLLHQMQRHAAPASGMLPQSGQPLELVC